MKTIKFRGKTIKDEWVYGDLIQIGGGSLIYHGDKQELEAIPQEDSPCAVGFYPNEISPVIPKTVGQFTNIYDKNRVEIYEGQKIKTKYYSVYNVMDIIEFHSWLERQFVCNPEKYIEIVGDVE